MNISSIVPNVALSLYFMGRFIYHLIKRKENIIVNFRIRIMAINLHKTLFYEAIQTELVSAVDAVAVMCLQTCE